LELPPVIGSVFSILLFAAAAPSGQIAFVAGIEQEDLCIMVKDLESGEQRSVGACSRDAAPVWSPDGQWIAFPSTQPDGMGIRVVRADGSEGRPLRHKYLWNFRPRWAPDGKRIAYSGASEEGLAQKVMVYDLATDTEREWAGGREGMMRPVWLPNLNLMRGLDPEEKYEWEGADARQLLAEANEHLALLAIGLVPVQGGLTTEIFVATESQAVAVLPLVQGAANHYEEWAVEIDRKAEMLAYESNDGGDREVYTLGRRGISDVSNHRAADWNPVWSPKEDWIAFESFRDGRRSLYRLYPDTARVYPLDVGVHYDCWSPCWSPDGDYIGYVSTQSGTPQIWVVDKQGEKTQQITQVEGAAYAPAWRPEED
jgi:Tol biopolymer transport system component